MTCRFVDLGNGATAIVCTRGERVKRCKECGDRASRQCDYPLAGRAAGKTCDAHLCSRCARMVGPDRDYCGPRFRLAQKRGDQLSLLARRRADSPDAAQHRKTRP